MIFFKLTLGYFLDMAFGDPYWLYHPVRLIGKLISLGEKITRRLFPKNHQGEVAAGGVMALGVVAVSFFVPFIILSLCRRIHPGVAFIVETFWIYQILAGKCLAVEAKKVFSALNEGKIYKARRLLGYLVGRDTKNLSEDEVIKAAVETVAENTTDGVIAPLIFIAIGGAPLGFAYKAINTMDSMVGYKNDKYRMFGRIPARLDDAVNFIPARISGLLMILCAFLSGYNGRGTARIFVRDRNKHLSPNSAQTESACAGALGLMLGGTHDYFGKPVEKPTIGDEICQPKPSHIQDACLLMGGTAFLAVFLLNMIKFAVTVLL